MSFLWGLIDPGHIPGDRRAVRLKQFRHCPSCKTSNSVNVYSCDVCRVICCDECKQGWWHSYCPGCEARLDLSYDHIGYT